MVLIALICGAIAVWRYGQRLAPAPVGFARRQLNRGCSLAATVNHDSPYNILVISAEEDGALAVNQVDGMFGGLCRGPATAGSKAIYHYLAGADGHRHGVNSGTGDALKLPPADGNRYPWADLFRWFLSRQ